MSKERLIQIIEGLEFKVAKKNLKELSKVVNKVENTEIYHHRGNRNLLVIRIENCHKVLEIV